MKLIEPLQKDEKLVDDIINTKLDGDFAVWWLGQSGFIIKSKEALIYVDLYLSDHLTEKYKDKENKHIRMTEIVILPHDLPVCDCLLSTHKHSDHMDPKTVPYILEKSKCVYILPKKSFTHVLTWGIDGSLLQAANTEKSIKIKDIEIITLPARHEKIEYSEDDGYSCVSYIIKSGNSAIYHSGDTIPFKGLVESLSLHNVNLALLPVNGRDNKRRSFGADGNCTGEEALAICELAGVENLIPHHYEMFTFNTIDIKSFEDSSKVLFPNLNVKVMQCGEKYILKRKGEING